MLNFSDYCDLPDPAFYRLALREEIPALPRILAIRYARALRRRRLVRLLVATAIAAAVVIGYAVAQYYSP